MDVSLLIAMKTCRKDGLNGSWQATQLDDHISDHVDQLGHELGRDTHQYLKAVSSHSKFERTRISSAALNDSCWPDSRKWPLRKIAMNGVVHEASKKVHRMQFDK
uniref:AlNc14C51G4006 protein n=2 Tax=Albugo laibachii Nc14 TaxID=890382 RepID=F0WBF9_9STRA|nr:AlNc14C51G4006 [Albugo laibachii Nc14]|eukprot:CCA18485.1 AlNc14C51G4006 [Albugo laibachii Nc14]